MISNLNRILVRLCRSLTGQLVLSVHSVGTLLKSIEHNFKGVIAIVLKDDVHSFVK